MVRGAREYATVLMDLIFGVLLFVQSFILLTEVVYYSQFIVALFLVYSLSYSLLTDLSHLVLLLRELLFSGLPTYQALEYSLSFTIVFVGEESRLHCI